MTEAELKALDKQIADAEKMQRKLHDERMKVKAQAVQTQSELDLLYARREAAKRVDKMSPAEVEALRAMLA